MNTKIKNIINGFYYSNEILLNIKNKIKNKKKPSLAILNIGKNISSHIYIKNKINACKKIKFTYQIYNLSQNISQFKLTNLIFKLNKKKYINGIITQLPLPKTLNINHILININIKKDVDGLNPINLGKIMINEKTFKTCIAAVITYIFKKKNINNNLYATIIGTSITVGTPIILELLKKNISITTCNEFTNNIIFKIKNSNILISAVGKINKYNYDIIKNKILIIDIGINKINNKTIGDLDFFKLKNKTKYITPIPGGVGPITVAMLLKNTFKAYNL
ncbi:MAG: bifunctional 5,10-methylenetetrahydrofolate dehydrogenase/5,10-methenyltetrahydrofolate cyclohydrolase [Candidatus Azosocius agrarius]|nr:MAG: bifunctional 5,10-methylenetetrahydrofolate dehydrogenase/5,10-methenyltetrahydrofolate cyclohydrolase [Gammaproteobacteria bacterium]